MGHSIYTREGEKKDRRGTKVGKNNWGLRSFRRITNVLGLKGNRGAKRQDRKRKKKRLTVPSGKRVFISERGFEWKTASVLSLAGKSQKTPVRKIHGAVNCEVGMQKGFKRGVRGEGGDCAMKVTLNLRPACKLKTLRKDPKTDASPGDYGGEVKGTLPTTSASRSFERAKLYERLEESAIGGGETT